MNPVLQVTDLTAGYGHTPVLHGISFSIAPGSVTILLGLNGAGKTTTVNTIAGLISSRAGEVRFGDTNIAGLPAEQVVRRGLSLCPEARRLFPELTVQQNLDLGGWTCGGLRPSVRDLVFDYFPILHERSKQLAGTLSGGEQQMLAIGRALVSEPKLLLIDEASLGLSPKFAEHVFQVVQRIGSTGVSILLVEQNVGAIKHADHVLVMEKGTLTFDGTPADLRESMPLLLDAYLGSMDLGRPAEEAN